MQIPGPVNIANNLTTTNSNYALSANMGKYLNDILENLVYRPGDRDFFEFNGGAILTTSFKEVYVSIPTKFMVGVNKVTAENINISIRQNNKYIAGSAEATTTAGFTVNVHMASLITVILCIKFNKALSGINNDAVALVVRGYLRFT